MKVIRYLAVIGLLVSTHVYGQNIALTDFEEIAMPTESSLLISLNQKIDQELGVKIIYGKLHVSKAKYQAVDYQLPEGKLMSYNRGEFGGALYYKAIDTSLSQIHVNGKLQKRILNERFVPGLLLISFEDPSVQRLKGAFLVTGGNFNKIFLYKDSVFVMDGLAHMGLRYGGFEKINIDKDKINITNVLKFDHDAPLALDVYKNNIYLVTSNGFYIINNWKLKPLIETASWGILYPNSVAVEDPEHIYVGMRGGYALLNSGGVVKFFQYKPK